MALAFMATGAGATVALSGGDLRLALIALTGAGAALALLALTRPRAGDYDVLRQAKETAEAASLAKSRYVRGVTHELRTPLNAILGYAQLLETHAALPDSLRHSVRVIRRSGAHLSDLVDGLLDISMIEAGRLKIYGDDVPLPEFLNQIADMFRLQARQKGLDFAFEAPARLPALVRMDEKRVRQVLLNLLSNAVRNTLHGRIVFRVRLSGEVCSFEVEDTGIGVAAEDMERIFLPFERVERPGAPHGAGLGLTITRLLTEGMGGELTAESTPGKGSLFRVRLMLAARAAAAPATRQAPAPPIGYAGPRRIVLVVDDDADHLGFMEEALTAVGFIVITAAGGEAALKVAAATPPDAVLLDISMPGMNGWRTASLLRAPEAARPLIVMISGDPRQDAERAGAAARHDASLMKPVNLAALLDLLGDRLGLDWRRPAPPPDEGAGAPPSPAALRMLRELGRIGHVRGVLRALDGLAEGEKQAAPALARLRRLAEDCEMDAFDAALTEMEKETP